MNNYEQQILDQITKSTGGRIWRPVREMLAKNLAKDRALTDEIYSVSRKTTATAPTTPNSPTTPTTPPTYGKPRPVENLVATESPTKRQDRTFSLVSVQFTRHPRDRFFSGVKIWMTGYQGNPNPVLMVDGSDSPISFLCESTKETVIITVQSVGLNGTLSDFATSPTASVVLDGVISAPPSPDITQSKTAIMSGATQIGWQFSFRFLTSLPGDVIDGYWIYKKTAHTTPTVADRIKYVAHAITGANVYVFQDSGSSTAYYYWVSAINQSGLESPLVDAEPVASGGPPVLTTKYPSIQSGNYVDPTKAYDNNSNSYAFGYASLVDGEGIDYREHIWRGFAAGSGFAVSVALKIMSSGSSGLGGGTIKLEYSLNNGSSWTTLYSGSGHSLDTINVPLNVAQDLTQVRVRGSAEAPYLPNKTTNARHNVYEIWIEEFN
jgi:hypothetical protein